MLTPDLFARSLESELRLSGRTFDRAALWAYVASCWPLMLDDLDPVRWAVEFVENVGAVEVARHSTPVLTANTYTHLRLHDEAEAAGHLPKLAMGDERDGERAGKAAD